MIPRPYQLEAEEAVFWSGLPVEKLPLTAEAAKAIGCRYFYTGEACVHGHLAPKYSAGGRCVVCAQEAAARDRKGQRRGPSGAARAHLVRALAGIDGDKTYIPSRPCKNGHYLRWVGTNNCIECESERKGSYSEARREAMLQKKYGITSAGYDAMVERQSGCCLICEEVVPGRTQLHVDHCHDTGRVRGLLCSRCNQGLGLFREDPAIIRKAAEYVEHAAA